MNLHPNIIKYYNAEKYCQKFSPTNKNEFGLWTKPWEDLEIFYNHRLSPDRRPISTLFK